MSDQPDELYDHPKKSRLRVGAILAIVVAVVGLAAGIAQVAQYVEDHNKPKLERFAQSSLAGKEKAVAFSDFLKRNDTKVAYLDIECPYLGEEDVSEWPEGLTTETRCFAQDGHQWPADKYPNTGWHIAPGPYNVHDTWFTSPESRAQGDERNRNLVIVKITIPDDSDARIANGPKGVGYLTAKGYFTVTRTTFGDAPPEATHYALRGVNSSAAQER